MCYFQKKIQRCRTDERKLDSRSVRCNKQGRSIEKRDANTIRNIIQQHIKPGTEIVGVATKGWTISMVFCHSQNAITAKMLPILTHTCEHNYVAGYNVSKSASCA